ncbi:DNA -binding domain-containing protein [Cystobacter fuscus]
MALDAANAGASYRDIAILLYGEAAAARRWRDPARHMKDAVRYAVRRGGALMEGVIAACSTSHRRGPNRSPRGSAWGLRAR